MDKELSVPDFGDFKMCHNTQQQGDLFVPTIGTDAFFYHSWPKHHETWGNCDKVNVFPRRSFLLEECCGKVLYYLRSLLLLSLYTDFEGLNVHKLVEHHSINSDSSPFTSWQTTTATQPFEFRKKSGVFISSLSRPAAVDFTLNYICRKIKASSVLGLSSCSSLFSPSMTISSW